MSALLNLTEILCDVPFEVVDGKFVESSLLVVWLMPFNSIFRTTVAG